MIVVEQSNIIRYADMFGYRHTTQTNARKDILPLYRQVQSFMRASLIIEAIYVDVIYYIYIYI